MAHHITALIGAPAALAALNGAIGEGEPRQIADNLVIIGLDAAGLDRLAGGEKADAVDGFYNLTPPVLQGIAAAVPNGHVLYIETDYFGGYGQQGAALFDQGKHVWSSSVSDDNDAPYDEPRSPISEGLARLGVIAAPYRDEFDTVGLGAFRHLSDISGDDD